MPVRSNAAGKKPAAAKAGSSKPKSFDFKSMKRASGGGGGGSSGSFVPSANRDAKPTTARARRTKYQSGDKTGEDTNNWIFCFNPKFGTNDAAKAAVEPHALGGDKISGFNKDLDGFTVRVYAPKQVEDMHGALRELDAEMSAKVELDGLVAPEMTIVTVENVDLPATKAAEEQEGVLALMLEGNAYPLYKKLRPLGYDFVRGVHGKEGINRWVRVVKGAADATKAEKETSAVLQECGWDVDTAAADAADWESEDEDNE